jgi:hypothetical protein
MKAYVAGDFGFTGGFVILNEPRNPHLRHKETFNRIFALSGESEFIFVDVVINLVNIFYDGVFSRVSAICGIRDYVSDKRSRLQTYQLNT